MNSIGHCLHNLLGSLQADAVAHQSCTQDHSASAMAMCAVHKYGVASSTLLGCPLHCILYEGRVWPCSTQQHVRTL